MVNSFSSPCVFNFNLFTITYNLFPALVGLTGIEPVTSSLSGTRSNQLSYKPNVSGAKGARNNFSLRF